MQSLALIGGGGFAKEVVEVAEAAGFRVADYYASRLGSVPLTYRGYLPELLANKDHYDGVALAIGAVNRDTIAARRELITWLDDNGFSSPSLISPHAIISSRTVIGAGSYIAPAALVAQDAKIGRFALINTNALIGHDTVTGENVTVSSLSFVGGATTIGDDTIIGAGARILQGARIGKYAMVGLGCTILRRVKDNETILPKL
jgi:sugar O-acyltransferase (sialic acid O-acetyltransferase NeuD family)